jgi:tRNA threonylcarbamoyladenosine dehydratase
VNAQSSVAPLLNAAGASGADTERRFGGLRRLYGDAGYRRLRGLRVAIVGVGGVGSWAAEALARCGVQALTLIDLDHVSESNINRQVQALGSTVGAAKVQALRERIADIHPGCLVQAVEDFVEPANWPALLPGPCLTACQCRLCSAARRAASAWATGLRWPISARLRMTLCWPVCGSGCAVTG